MTDWRLIGSVHIDHPSQREREASVQSDVYLLATPGKVTRRIPLTEDELLRLVASGAKVLAILRGVRT